MEIWERFGIAGWARGSGGAEGLERGHRRDPGGDGGGEVFGEEGAEGLVLPGLDVAGGPVVEEADAEEVVGGFGDGDGGAEEAGLADVKRQFEFVVEGFGGKEVRLGFARWRGRVWPVGRMMGIPLGTMEEARP